MPKKEELMAKLSAAAVESVLPHAVLIEGEKGTGRTELALWLARVLLCKSENPPCEHCMACKKVLTDNHPDVEIIGGTGKIQGFHIDRIREIKDSLWLAPNEAEIKIYILTDIGDMTVEAQNALLKSLEEPPSFVRFIMTCENRFALLDTIISRSAVYSLEPMSEAECTEALRKQFTKISEEDAKLFSVAFGGNFGAAKEAFEGDKAEITRLAQITPGLLRKGRTYDLATQMNSVCKSKQILLEYTQILAVLVKSSATSKICGREPVINIGIKEAAETAEICEKRKNVLMQPGGSLELLQSLLCMELEKVFGGNL